MNLMYFSSSGTAVLNTCLQWRKPNGGSVCPAPATSRTMPFTEMRIVGGNGWDEIRASPNYVESEMFRVKNHLEQCFNFTHTVSLFSTVSNVQFHAHGRMADVSISRTQSVLFSTENNVQFHAHS